MKRTDRKLSCWLCLIAAAATAAPALAGAQVVRLKLSGPMTEAPAPDAELIALLGGDPPVTLRETVERIHKATQDASVGGIALIIDQPQIGLSQIQELRQALRAFREAGKPVYCYIDTAGNGDYALATAADHIMLAEYSDLWITGLLAELSYYKNMFEKIGVRAEMLHCGAYKSALEPFTRTAPSPEAAENVNWLLDGIHEAWVRMMAEGRGKSVEEMQKLIDQAPIRAADALEHRLVDAVGGFEEFSQLIREKFGPDVEVLKKYPKDKDLDIELDPGNPFALFSEINRVMEELFGGAQAPDEPGIALVFIEGGITVGKSDQGLFGTVAGSTSIRAAFDEAAENDHIKAVVVRVNSPGGSALGSDIIWRAAMRVAKSKPLIVSMGGVAGSGGYYVALPGDVIFADETTITGSIGVVGGKLVWNELWEDKLGVNTVEFKRGARADWLSMNSGWSDEQRAAMQDYLDAIYEQFKSRVRANRGDKLNGELEQIAQGKVYTGRQALDLGLIDRIGTLSDAIAHAAEKANLEDPKVYVLPKKKGLAEVFAQLMGETPRDEWEISAPAGHASQADLLRSGGLGDPLLQRLAPLLHALAPQRTEALMRDLYQLSILNREHVGMFMPFRLNIR